MADTPFSVVLRQVPLSPPSFAPVIRGGAARAPAPGWWRPTPRPITRPGQPVGGAWPPALPQTLPLGSLTPQQARLTRHSFVRFPHVEGGKGRLSLIQEDGRGNLVRPKVASQPQISRRKTITLPRRQVRHLLRPHSRQSTNGNYGQRRRSFVSAAAGRGLANAA